MIKQLKTFLLFWSTQALSQLGSSMTSFALTIWLYEETGSALKSSLLMICSYAPYVVISIFAGALSDKWNKKKTMLICDSLAALMTLIVLILLINNSLRPWHIYLINIVEGFMNSFQGPASETTMSLITPKEYYQKTSGLKSFSRSLITILNPVLSTALYSLFGMKIICVIDLISFLIAFVSLLFIDTKEEKNESISEDIMGLIQDGFNYLKDNRLILDIIIFMSGINFVASAFDSAITPLVLSKTNSETILGIVNSSSGIAMLVGSFIATLMKEPKNKAITIYWMIFISMLLENFIIALSNNPIMWCFGQVLGWLPIPIFSTSYEVLFKNTIPIEMQGRVYSFRNCLQFFTIPIGYFVGGLMVDLFEPLMNSLNNNVLSSLFGYGLGSGAALAMFVLGILGVVWCIPFFGKLDDNRLKEQ